MRWIRRIRIENFQSHRYTVLNLNPGLNVIIGASNEGKSAIVRAIRWAVYNEPKGEEFIRIGTEWARVELEMSDGFTIIRERGKGLNRYTLRYPDGREQHFEGFGYDIPEEIVKAHGMERICFDVDKWVSLNIGFQLDPPFLIGEPGSVKAKAIGSLVGSHYFDAALRGVGADLGRVSQEMRMLSDDLDSKRESMKGFEGLDTYGERLEKAGEFLRRWKKLEARVCELIDLRKRYGGLLEEGREMQKIASRRQVLAKVEEMGSRIDRLAEGLSRLEEIRDVLGSIRMERRRIMRDLEGKREKKASAESALMKIMKRSGVCPTCGRGLDEESLDRIAASYKEDGLLYPYL